MPKPLVRPALLALSCLLLGAPAARAASQVCPRPAAGGPLQQPPSLSSHHGVLRAQLSYETRQDDDGRTLFCYQTPEGLQNPTLRLQPGDRLELTVQNHVPESHEMEMLIPAPNCAAAKVMTASSMNVHYHGTNTSPTCGQDDVLRTVINSGESFTYELQIPDDEPPGLYWYHPHIHGIAEAAVLGGASGAIVIEGLERLQPAVAGLRERLLVVRDQTVAGSPAAGGDVPSWDLTVNQLPIAYPNPVPAQLEMRSGERELWRAVNASADSILDLQVRFDGAPQELHVVALDGVPTGSQDGTRRGRIVNSTHLLLAPGARAEWIQRAPPAHVAKAELVTLNIDTGPAGDSDPERVLATVRSSGRAALQPVVLPEPVNAGGPQRFEGLARAPVSRVRRVYFSEVISDPTNPLSPTNFFITEDGATPQLFDPQNGPSITVTQGSVEEWIIENRAPELHEFHIHQIHFLLLDRDGVPVPEDERQYLDMVQVPYWTGSGPYPSVRVRMDFRGPDIGDFVYHCHILGHEDNGMMAIIRVLPRPKKK
jgi:FtsP/CotA-like multicopper oxidase with cupredoxin domain